MERIGFVGVGIMGEGMARKALERGHPLTVVAHRQRAGVERLCADGAEEAADLAALAKASDVIAICVSDAPAVERVVARLKPREGQLIVDITTSDPDVSRRLAAELAREGIAFADAPVTGSPAQAAEGTVATLLGAADKDVARATAVVDAWSKVVRHFGPPGAGHTAKLINNFITQGTTALLADAYGRARRAGIDWSALHDVMSTGAARSGTFEKIVPAALGGDFDGARFSMANAAKDARYYAVLAERMDGVAPPLAVAVHEAINRFVEAGHGDAFVSRMLDPAIADAVG